MKRLIAVCTCAVLSMVASAAEGDQQALIDKIEAMQRQVAAQQAAIEALKSELLSQKEKVDKVVEKSGSAISLGKGIDNLKLKGDLRLRYERRDVDGGANRDRLRTRFRLGMVWQNDEESWEVAAGLATGEKSDGADIGSSGATSTNDTWSGDSPFETGEIFLDYAYAKHTMGCTTLTLGQQKNPFVGSWLLFDGDIRPAGATVKYDNMGLFAAGGVYDVIQFGNDMGALYAGQVGYAVEQEDGIDYTVALAYFDYTDKAEGAIGAPADADYDFQILDLYATVGIPVGEASVSLYADYFTNLGADGATSQAGGGLDPDDEDTGWVVGIDAKMGAFSAGYAYARIEADACPAELKDADFGTGVDATNIKGHKLALGYKLTKNCSLKGTALFYEELENNDEEADLYQIDLSYKF